MDWRHLSGFVQVRLRLPWSFSPPITKIPSCCADCKRGRVAICSRIVPWRLCCMLSAQRRVGKHYCSRKWSIVSSKHIRLRQHPHPPECGRRTCRILASESLKSWLPSHEGNAAKRLPHTWG